MRSILKRRPSASMAVAFIALVAALSGTAVALPGTNSVNSGDIKNNSVRSKDVRNNNITSRDLKNNNVHGRDVRNDSLTGNDVNESTLGAVPTAANATRLSDVELNDFHRYTGGVPSGKTVVGAWGAQRNNLTAAETFNQVVQFPVPAGAGLAAANINFAPSASAGDDDATCTGSAGNPTAPAGKVCLYLSTASNVQANSLGGYQISSNADDNKFGFNVGGNAAAIGDVDARGSWAYTAP